MQNNISGIFAFDRYSCPMQKRWLYRTLVERRISLGRISAVRWCAGVVAVLSLMCGTVSAQPRKVQNLPYADYKLLHLGFSIGTHVQDMTFVHSGFVTEGGESWYMDIPDFSPGFNVNLMADLYLCQYLNLRVSPGIFFGNKVVKYRESNTQEYRTQDLKSNYIVLPVELKFSAERCNNFRPYLIGGVMATADVSKKKNDLLKLNTFDGYLTIGFGCDLYLPYFKLIPELKFCFGLADVINRNRSDLKDPADIKFTQSLKKATSNMVVLSFYFE